MANVKDKLRNSIGRVFGFGPSHNGAVHHAPLPPGATLKERMDARFEGMMQEIDELSNNTPTLEEKGEYGWIVAIRFLLPLVFFVAFGYEDGLFMTGFRYLSWEPFVMIMYAIGYGLEGLRVAMVYSMNFSKSEGRKKAFQQQMAFWVVLSLGCGIAQLAAALVIQALGAHQAVTGENAVAQGAAEIMARMPFLVYLAIGVRVVLCAVADWACSGYLHKKKETVEQKVAVITTRATNLQSVMQAQINAETMIDNARHFQEIIQDERSELKELRHDQKEVFSMVFRAGMHQFRSKIEVEADKSPIIISEEEE